MKNLCRIVFSLFVFLFFFGSPRLLHAEDVPASPGKNQSVSEENQTDPVLARVNSMEIHESDLERAVNATLAQNPQLRSMVSSPDKRQGLRRGVLNQLVSTELLILEGRKLKIKDLVSKTEERLRGIQERFPSKEAFLTSLNQQHMSEKELREKIQDGIRVRQLIDLKVRKGISISDKDVKSYYDKNKDKFKQPEAVKVSHILIRVKRDAKAEEVETARKKIEDLLKRARKGEDFAALAKANSEDPAAARNGGELGYFTRGQMVPEFEKAAFALKVGAISDVVKTSYGFHIIKCEGKKESRTVPYSEVKERISQYLENMAVQPKLAKYVESLKKNAKVEILMK